MEEALEAQLSDSGEFSCPRYMNAAFPSEQALCGLDAAAGRCAARAEVARGALRAAVRGAHDARRGGAAALTGASDAAASLALQVSEINKKAERSESQVGEITREIKQLDAAKSNLTAAITALNHYHMLVGGAASLERLTAARRYGELAAPLQACRAVLAHFQNHRGVHTLARLGDLVDTHRAKLAEQILEDFKDAFGGNKSGVTARTLTEACVAVDALGDSVRESLVEWLVTVEVREYEIMFAPGEPAAGLDRLDKRYGYIKKHLLSFEESRGLVFPAAWCVGAAVARALCLVTRDQLRAVLAAPPPPRDVKLLLYGIHKTRAFETLLRERYGEEEPPSEQSDPPAQSGWVGLIGVVFEPHLSLYIASLDDNLRQLMDSFIQEAKRAQSTPGEPAAGGRVLSSCAELFVFYKKCLVQCGQLSTGEPMCELSGVFAQYLREYCTSVLQAGVPRGAGSSLTALATTLLRDDHVKLLSSGEVARLTSVISTAEYCRETVLHLQDKLREKLQPALRTRADLQPEVDMFSATIDTCVQLLAQDLEASCAGALGQMFRASWSSPAVGERGPHVQQLLGALRPRVTDLRDQLSAARKYYTQICVRFAHSFCAAYTQRVYRCRSLSAAGAEQMLLDTHTLKMALLSLPCEPGVERAAPPAYTRVVLKLIGRAETALQLSLSPLEPEKRAREAARLLPELAADELRLLLSMRGDRPTRALVDAAMAAVDRTH